MDMVAVLIRVVPETSELLARHEEELHRLRSTARRTLGFHGNRFR